jgi:hypothetical protein
MISGVTPCVTFESERRTGRKGRDAVPGNGDVAIDPRVARAIDDAGVGDDEVVSRES